MGQDHDRPDGGRASASPDPLRPDGGSGLRDETHRVPGVAIVGGIGALWGALCYSVLWEGTPFAVDRAFVESVFGTLVLLPVRIVLWAIRWAELASDRTFDLADNHLWIGFVASTLGAAIAALAFLAVRTIARRLRRLPTAPGRPPRTS
jgi:hypothetical protein